MTLWAHKFVTKVDAFYLKCDFCNKKITGLEPSTTKAVDAAELQGARVLQLPGGNVLACKSCKTHTLMDFAEGLS